MDVPDKDRAVADDDIKRSIEALFKEAEGRSVSDLLARHNRERLFIRPLLWDYRQPALLRCRFFPRKRPAPPLPTAVAPPSDKDWVPRSLKDEKELAGYLHLDPDPYTAFELLDSRYPVYPGCHEEHIKFFYGRRPLCRVGCGFFISSGVCYLGKSAIQSARDRLVNGRLPGACQRYKAVSNARRRFAAPTSMPDPYMAALFIAFAQAQRLWEEEKAKYYVSDEDDDSEAAEAQQPDQDAGGRERTSPTGEAQVIPIVILVHEGEHLAVFAADVTLAFLAKLDDPGKPPPPGASMDIHQQRVKFLPYKTFAARFAGAVRDTRHRRRPGDQDVGQSSSAGQEGKGSALLCSASDNALPLWTGGGADAAKPRGADMKRKHSDGADQWRADLQENQCPPNTKKRRGENESTEITVYPLRFKQ